VPYLQYKFDARRYNARVHGGDGVNTAADIGVQSTPYSAWFGTRVEYLRSSPPAKDPIEFPSKGLPNPIDPNATGIGTSKIFVLIKWCCREDDWHLLIKMRTDERK
jgi:hypothetical protein